MDVNVFRGLLAVVCLLAFLGIVAWAWSRNQRERFAEAAMLPFAEEDQEPKHHG